MCVRVELKYKFFQRKLRLDDEQWAMNNEEYIITHYSRPMVYLFKRIYTSDIHTGNQQVDVMGAFIGQNRFQVHHMAHDGVLIGDSHPT